MKGQAVFEFVIAAVLFFAIIFYMLNFLNATFAEYSGASQLNELESKALGVSEYLTRLNLTDSWPVLSTSRISFLEEFCNQDENYADNLLPKFDIDGSRGGGMKILIKKGAQVLADCDASVPIREKQRAEITRYALSEDNELLDITVTVW